ncbi:hypothetical protein CA13_54470 [Planctomycetes bacterium CA13]|uniref:Uncharacterized protein n=2 Tax=Novipirellula herctigrandis TaxID=2527986 RepID=A0A5C5ZBN5_9BACT|nr:hypothetical protein CA13_54470 [Planctomycetes bacterium CA13]
MRQWTSFEPSMPNVVVVECELACKRQSSDRWGPAIRSPQEIPACYFTRNFDVVQSYLGDGKWKDEVQPPGPPWGRALPLRHAMACFEPGGQGIAIFSPTSTEHWNFGPHGVGLSDDPKAGPCMHLAPVARVLLGPQSTYRYRYWIIVGDRDEISDRLDSLWQNCSDDVSKLDHSWSERQNRGGRRFCCATDESSGLGFQFFPTRKGIRKVLI